MCGNNIPHFVSVKTRMKFNHVTLLFSWNCCCKHMREPWAYLLYVRNWHFCKGISTFTYCHFFNTCFYIQVIVLHFFFFFFYTNVKRRPFWFCICSCSWILSLQITSCQFILWNTAVLFRPVILPPSILFLSGFADAQSLWFSNKMTTYWSLWQEEKFRWEQQRK